MSETDCFCYVRNVHIDDSFIKARIKLKYISSHRCFSSVFLTALRLKLRTREGEVSPRKSVVQSACQYDVMSRVSNFLNVEQSVDRRDG